MADPATLRNKNIVMVTGGLGFIGKSFVRKLLDDGHFVINVDIVNYAADRKAMAEFATANSYRFMREDVATLQHLPECDFIVNFAAESHVDNSINRNTEFCHSNFMGTHRLLELVREKRAHDRPHFIQISTDEVYGDIIEGQHSESDPLKPSNPYSASKAAADMLVLGWARTYDVQYNILRITNNYGPHQFPEKLIPKSSGRMLRGLPALMHGDGSYIRSWLHVQDTVSAILTVMMDGEPNLIYNVSGSKELSVKQVILQIAQLMDVPEEKAYIAVTNRVGQDLRYDLDDSRIRALGWKPLHVFDQEISNIVSTFEFDRFL